MKEELLYFIWHLQYFDKQALSTTEGHTLAVMTPGMRNKHSGPDFDQARLHLDGMEWVGSVEIHVNASEWDAHGHQHDAAYNRVVLHVVWRNDRTVCRQDGTLMPTLELQHRVDALTLQNYRRLVFEPLAQQEIPCASHLSHVDRLTKLSMLEKTAVLRLDRKAKEIEERLKKNRGEWTTTAYQTLVKSMGFRVNSAAFEQLSSAAPLSLIRRYHHSPDTLAALLLGQAGLMDHEDWPSAWPETYRFLQAKHQLADGALVRSQWRFFRTRPANFPTVRVVQLARLLVACSGDLAVLFEQLPTDQHVGIFQNSGKDLFRGVPTIGVESIYKILINAVVPYQFAYGNFFGEQRWKDHAVSLLQALPPEKNQLVSKYRKYGYDLASALDTQAVLELHHSFCEQKRCLSCAVGASIVKSNKLFVTSAPH